MTTNIVSAVEYIHELREKFTEDQAELIVKIIDRQAQVDRDQQTELEALKAKEAATKGDVRESELRLEKEILATKADIRELRLELHKEIKSLEIRLFLFYSAGFLGLLGVLARGFHWI